jgi:hypothetical protein
MADNLSADSSEEGGEEKSEDSGEGKGCTFTVAGLSG